MPLRLLVFSTHAELPLECSKTAWNMLSVPHYTPLAFSSQSIYLGNKNRGLRLQRRRVLRGDTVGPVLKNALMGRYDMVSATEGRKDTVECSKNPAISAPKAREGKIGPNKKTFPKP